VKRLKEGLEKYHSIFANSNESFLLFMVRDEALGGSFIDANNAACNLLGYSTDEIRSLSIDDIIIRSSFSSITEIKQVLLSQNLNIFQMHVRTKGGLSIPVEISFHAYSLKGENYILMIMRDITERFLNEQKIHIALEEKEVLLYEIHHRVKNNLQIITSLLDMVSMRVRDNDALNFLKDLESKIYTMSLLHTHLYKHERFDSINISECFRDIIQHLGRLYNTENICIHIDCPDIFIPINTAIPVCLVINEALSNATRHAFTGIGNDRMRAIWICSSIHSDGEIILSIRDNGIGFPEKIDSDTTSSIGIKLMRTIVHDQLKGSFSINSNNGTEIVVQFGYSHNAPPA
jgi:PAS domain S-box-containing protein